MVAETRTGRLGLALLALVWVAACGTRSRQLSTEPGVAEGEGSAGAGDGSGISPGTGTAGMDPGSDDPFVPGDDGPMTGTSGTGAGGGVPGGMDPKPGDRPCRGDVPTICRACPDGTCGRPVCRDGTWEFWCSSDPGLPTDPSVCPDFLPQICKQCPDGSCGEPVCVNGAWDFICRAPPPPPPPCGDCGFWEPVCGFDGFTYNAACGMQCIPVEIACRGECPCFRDPCLNAFCGDFCDPCGGDPGCIAPPVQFFCDEKAQCTSLVPACLIQPEPACMVMEDCPAIEFCAQCPNGRCAVQACLDHVCQLVCPF